MSKKIQQYRGLEKDLPLLEEGRIAFTTDTKKVFIGSKEGNVDFTNKDKAEKIEEELAEVTQQLDQVEIKDLIYKKRIMAELAFQFPDWSTALAKVGSTYMFPQGIAVDEENKQLFISHWTTGLVGVWVSVYNLDTYKYISCFRLNPKKDTTSSQGEGLVYRKEGNSRYLYAKVAGSDLSKYDITVHPDNLSFIDPTVNYSLDIRQHYTFNGVHWFVQQGGTSTENNKGNLYNCYDADFNPKGLVMLDNSVGGYRSGAFFNYGVKSQGMTSNSNYLIQLEGGAVNPDTSTTTAYHYHGLKLIDYGGNLIREGTLEPRKMISILREKGYDLVFLEYEAITTTASGKVYSILLTKNSSTGGVLILEEMSTHEDAIDFSPAKGGYLKINKQQLSAEMLFPTGSSKRLVNPLTGQHLSTIDEILDFMLSASMRTLSFHTNHAEVWDFNGNKLPTDLLYSLIAIDPNRAFLTIRNQNGNYSEYVISGTTGTRVLKDVMGDWQKYKLSQDNGSVIYPSGFTKVVDLPTGFYFLTGSNAVNYTDLPIAGQGGYVEVYKATGENKLIRFTSSGTQSHKNRVYEKVINDGNDYIGWSFYDKIITAEGSPEGKVSALRSQRYVDDLNGDLYYKTSSSGNTGVEEGGVNVIKKVTTLNGEIVISQVKSLQV